MKFILSLLLALLALAGSGLSGAWAAPLGRYEQGTIVRMHMGDCVLKHRGFMNQFGPSPADAVEENCPEYTLVTEKVVYVIVGKASSQLVPFAEVVDFRLKNKELAIRVDDARKETKFDVKDITLRSQWDLLQKRRDQEIADSPHQPVDASLRLRSRE